MKKKKHVWELEFHDHENDIKYLMKTKIKICFYYFHLIPK